jgi:hypothetical protein
MVVIIGVVLAGPPGRPSMPNGTEYMAVPIIPVVYDGSDVQVGLQLPDGNWATSTIDQRFPCLGKIVVDIPYIATVQVHLNGSEPEWQEVPVTFDSLGQTFTTRILVVPQNEVINEMQLNVPMAGQALQIQSGNQWPLAVVEMAGTTPLRVDVPPATQQILQVILNLLNIGDVDLADIKGEIPNAHVRWITIGDDGRAAFMAPDPDHVDQVTGQDSQRVRVMGAGAQQFVR